MTDDEIADNSNRETVVFHPLDGYFKASFSYKPLFSYLSRAAYEVGVEEKKLRRAIEFLGMINKEGKNGY